MEDSKNKQNRTNTVLIEPPLQEVPLSRPDITELEMDAVFQVLQSPNLALGPELKAFEKAFCETLGRRHAIAVNSGTSGLFLSLKALGIGPGDEVITTPFTFIASTTSIMMTGAIPVFVDIDPISLNIDPQAVEQNITDKTKAILPVEVFGNPTHINTLEAIAHQHNLAFIEDSCEALGTTLHQRPAGTFGDISVFAFYPNKQITTGEGGIILTDHREIAEQCISLRNQGRGAGGGWLSHTRLGYNFRLSDINCALGRVQLSRLSEIKQKRTQVAEMYLEKLAHETRITLPSPPPNADMSWFVFVVRLNDTYTQAHRDQLLHDLAQRGIQASNYFPPVHLQPFIRQQYGYTPGTFPATEQIAERTIALPFYNNLSELQVDYVCSQLTQSLDLLS